MPTTKKPPSLTEAAPGLWIRTADVVPFDVYDARPAWVLTHLVAFSTEVQMNLRALTEATGVQAKLLQLGDESGCLRVRLHVWGGTDRALREAVESITMELEDNWTLCGSPRFSTVKVDSVYGPPVPA